MDKNYLNYKLKTMGERQKTLRANKKEEDLSIMNIKVVNHGDTQQELEDLAKMNELDNLSDVGRIVDYEVRDAIDPEVITKGSVDALESK